MTVKLAIVLPLLVIASASHAYFVLNTWADENCNTTLIARYFTSDPTPCQRKRATAQEGGQCEADNLGVYYSTDITYCDSATEPEFPAGWQSVRFGEDLACNYTTSDTSYSSVGAQSLENIPVAVFYLHVGNVAVNTTIACASSGVLSVALCIGSNPCLDYSLPNGACVADATNSTFATQNSCIAAPVAPVSAPLVMPIAAPTSDPVQTPDTTPSQSNDAPSSSFLFFGSAALGAFICLVFF